MSDTTVDSVLKELRNAIFFSSFHATVGKVNMQKWSEDVMRQKACGFVEFGVASGLMSQDEADGWGSYIWQQGAPEDWGKHLSKYMPEPEDSR